MRTLCCLLLLGLWNMVLASCPYYRFTREHSYCLKPNKECKLHSNTPVTEAETEEIVRLHNEFRSKVASGKESTGNLPSATDMLEMQWDEELAEIARRWAAQCKYGHDCKTCGRTRHFWVGQSVHIEIKKNNWENAIRDWYSEVKDFNSTMVDKFGYPYTDNLIGHFTQMVWAKSWRVGCGRATYTDSRGYTWELLVCNYGPWGNYPMSPVYRQGQVCSQCPWNTCCGDKCNKASYPGLCQVQEGKIPVHEPPVETKYHYYCNFSDIESCGLTMSKAKRWKVYDSLVGNYIGIILKKGEESNITIGTIVQPDSPSCLTVFFRKGDNVAGEESRNVAEIIISRARSNRTRTIEIEKDLVDFLPKMVEMGIAGTFSLTVRFKSLSGTAFMEIQEISLREGSCDPNKILPIP